MPARQRDSPMSDSMAMSIACPTANELWELAERERGGAGYCGERRTMPRTQVEKAIQKRC